jgi:imidazole glycerol-phosphate synthase subunit HisH
MAVPLAIIDYGVGNLRSVEKAFVATGCEAVISNDEVILRAAERLVLPGVGAFGACMRELHARGFDQLVQESEEFGPTAGLGLMRGRVRRFPGDLLVPQVGWNQVQQLQAHPLLASIEEGTFFYFVHSYYCEATDSTVVLGETEYGAPYASVVARRNVCGVQFHPEKSQAAGLRLLKNFALGAGQRFEMRQPDDAR